MTNGYYTTVEYREKLYAELRVSLKDTVILMCAIFIASIGLNMNSTAVIIGAMLISPLMTPITGLGLGLALLDFRLLKKSLVLLTSQVFVSLTVSTVYFWLSPISYASSELIARTSPTIWDVLIAIAGGIAGVIGSRKKDANNIVPGVAIATALMPPICTAGYGLATQNMSFFIGALYLFLINSTFIMLSNFIGSTILMKKSLLSLFKEFDLRIRVGLIFLSLLLTIPAAYSAASLTLEYAKKDAISKFISTEFADYTIINKVYSQANSSLELTVVGERLSADAIKEIEEKQETYGIGDVKLKVNQVLDTPNISGNEIADLYKYIDKYIEQKTSETDIKPDGLNADTTIKTDPLITDSDSSGTDTSNSSDASSNQKKSNQ